VVVDFILQRQPFFPLARAVFQLVATGKISGLVSASSVTDVYYLVQRELKDHFRTLNSLIDVSKMFRLADTTKTDIRLALSSPMKDFEDAVVAATAARERADFIITRNVADFTASPVAAVSPDDFLTRWHN
jgi:predicted nucleic acid-binding protein